MPRHSPYALLRLNFRLLEYISILALSSQIILGSFFSRSSQKCSFPFSRKDLPVRHYSRNDFLSLLSLL